MSPCSSLCTASSAFMLTQLQAFSLCCGVHVIVLNWVWQYKNGNPSSPKQADFSRCFHWQDWSWLHGHNHKCNAHHSFFSTPLITGLWAWLHSSVTVWTDIWEYCCPSPFYFWILLTHFALFFRYCYKDDPQFCWLYGWWHLWNIICIWCFHKGWASSQFSSWPRKRGHCNLGIALISDKYAPHHLHLHIYIQCQQSMPKEGGVPYL